MKNNEYKLPTFWWVNPWAHARYLIGAAGELSRRYIDVAEKHDVLLSKLADEVLGHSDTKAEVDRLTDRVYELSDRNKELEAKLADAEAKRNGTCYSKATKAMVRKAAAEGLTLEEACTKYGFSRGAARTVASLIKVSFRWSGKGRKPKHNRG